MIGQDKTDWGPQRADMSDPRLSAAGAPLVCPGLPGTAIDRSPPADRFLWSNSELIHQPGISLYYLAVSAFLERWSRDHRPIDFRSGRRLAPFFGPAFHHRLGSVLTKAPRYLRRKQVLPRWLSFEVRAARRSRPRHHARDKIGRRCQRRSPATTFGPFRRQAARLPLTDCSRSALP